MRRGVTVNRDTLFPMATSFRRTRPRFQSAAMQYSTSGGHKDDDDSDGGDETDKPGKSRDDNLSSDTNDRYEAPVGGQQEGLAWDLICRVVSPRHFTFRIFPLAAKGLVLSACSATGLWLGPSPSPVYGPKSRCCQLPPSQSFQSSSKCFTLVNGFAQSRQSFFWWWSVVASTALLGAFDRTSSSKLN